MSSQGRDISDVITRSYKNLNAQLMAQILTNFNRRTTPQTTNEAVPRHVIFDDLVDLHDITSVLSNTIDIDPIESMLHFNQRGYSKFVPDEVRVYDLTHDNSNASGITFPFHGNTFDENGAVTSIGRKSSGCAQTNGTSYQIINNHSWFNVTDEILIHGWVYLKAASADGMIIHKGTDQWLLKVMATDTLRFSVQIGGVTYNLDYAYTPNAWYHIVATAKSGTQSLWVNNVLQDSDTQVGAIGTNLTNVGIFAQADGTNKLVTGNALSWLSIANGFADSTWVGNSYTKRLLDYDTDVANTPEEITTFPYVSSLIEQPNATPGLFMS